MSKKPDYEARINRVVEYISEHIDQTIDLNVLADVACMSPYHWHRVYVGMRGESVAATVKRLRLQRASALLIASRDSIASIARQCGYSNLQSFTRIFKSVYGLPPAAYRQRGQHVIFDQPDYQRKNDMFEVEIQELETRNGYGVRHSGPYIGIHKAFDRVCGWAGKQKLFDQETTMFGLYYDDPDSVDAEKLRSVAGVFAAQDAKPQAPVESVQVEGGRYAILEFVGPYEALHKAYRWLYGQWLNESGEAPADKPSLEIYLNDPQETPPTELRTRVCMPLV